MSFFDKKEEVLNVELTQYGKSLLSMGKFKPALYAFFDDDILYEPQFGGIVEKQSEVSARIRNETPSLKPQYVYTGLETEFKKAQRLFKTITDADGESIQSTIEKHYTLSAPLGNSEYGEENSPSFGINILNGGLTGSVQFKSGSHGNVKIPQLTAKTITYETYVATAGVNDNPSAILFGDFGDEGAGTVSDLNLASPRFEDGSYIRVLDDHLLIEIVEDNINQLNENFDIEVFVEEIDLKTGKEIQIPLSFRKNKPQVVNNILLDQDEVDFGETILGTPDFVSHYFNVYVDREISPNVLCKALGKIKRPPGFLVDNTIDCEEAAVLGESARIGDETIVTNVRGLYDSGIPDDVDPADDDCEDI